MIRKVLFVCTGNTCRSAMAEALLRKMLPADPGEDAGELEIYSAGIRAEDGQPASKHAILVMKDEGIDLSKHKARQIRDEDIDRVDLILTMTFSQKRYVLDLFPEAASKTFALKEFIEGAKTVEDIFLEISEIRKTLEETREYKRKHDSRAAKLKAQKERLYNELKKIEEKLGEYESRCQNLEKNHLRLLELEKKLQAYEISDPFGQDMDAYKSCALEIKENLEKLVRKIKNNGEIKNDLHR